MGRPKKQVENTTSNELVKTVSTGSITDFELAAEITAGTLKSNAIELRAKIEAELKNYSVEKYIDNPDAAITDKALLNKVKDSVAAKRKEIIAAWNQPLDDFLTEMKALECAVSIASSQINEIVKAAENKEKEAKREQIERYWSTLDFTLVSLDKIFNPKWLNKTYQFKDIMLDVEAITEKITTELSTIKSMAGEDNEILRAFYLDTLDLNATLQRGNQLRNNREILKAEEAKKAAENTINNLANAGLVESKEAVKVQQSQPVQNPVTNKMTFTLRLTGTVAQLQALRKYIDDNKITYEKVL